MLNLCQDLKHCICPWGTRNTPTTNPVMDSLRFLLGMTWMRMMLHRQYCWKWMGKWRKSPIGQRKKEKRWKKKSMFERLEICHDWWRHWCGHCHGARSTNRPGLPCAFFTPTLLPTLFFIKRTCIIWGIRHLDRNIRHRQLNLGLDFCNRRGTRNKQIFRPSFGRGIPRGRRFYTRTTCWANKVIVLQNRSPPNCAPRFFDLRHNIPLVGFYRTGVKCQGRPQCCARRAWVEPPLPCIRCRSWGKFFHNCFWNRRWNWPTSTATKAGRTRCQWRASAAVVVAHHGPRPRRHGWRWEKLLSGETESFVVLIGHESSKIVGSKKVSCMFVPGETDKFNDPTPSFDLPLNQKQPQSNDATYHGLAASSLFVLFLSPSSPSFPFSFPSPPDRRARKQWCDCGWWAHLATKRFLGRHVSHSIVLCMGVVCWA